MSEAVFQVGPGAGSQEPLLYCTSFSSKAAGFPCDAAQAQNPPRSNQALEPGSAVQALSPGILRKRSRSARSGVRPGISPWRGWH